MTDDKKHEEGYLILKQLITKHFWGDRVKWSYIEGVGLQDVDKELYARIVLVMSEVEDES